MATDPFASAISTVMTGLGYQVQVVTEPKQRKYDPAMPTLFVAPIGKSRIYWIAFPSGKSCRQTYELAYAFPNQLDPSLADNNVWQFKLDTIDNFMGISSAMRTAGAWNTATEDVTDFDRGIFSAGLTYSVINVNVDYLPS